MSLNRTFCVSNWKSFKVVTSDSPLNAVSKAYSHASYWQIPSDELTDESVTHAMCCEYIGEAKVRISNCMNDIDRVLLLNMLPETAHFQIEDLLT